MEKELQERIIQNILTRHTTMPHTPRRDGTKCRCDLCVICDHVIELQKRIDSLENRIDDLTSDDS